MDCGASKSDIDFEFDSSDSADDVSIATNGSSAPATPLSRHGVHGMAKKFDKVSLQQQQEDKGHEFLNGIGGDDSDSNSDLSIGSEELISPRTSNGRRRRRVSEEFGPAIVIPLKTGSDHSFGDATEPVEPGSRSSRCSRRSNRSGSFNRRAPVRTKSGEGMSNSTHSAVSGRRRPPMRTKSGEGIVKNDIEGASNHRRRPPPRTKSGNDSSRRRAPQRTKSGGGTTLRGGKKDNGEYGNGEKSAYYKEKLPDHDVNDYFNASAVPTSPARRHKSAGDVASEYREMALNRNSARRQRSSDMLGAMRDATRTMPSRSQSSAIITNGRRRGPNRSKSGDLMGLKCSNTEELASPGRRPLRRKAPSGEKSGGKLRPAPPLET
jgi:hypothetical protein